jgi:hypothetical protein
VPGSGPQAPARHPTDSHRHLLVQQAAAAYVRQAMQLGMARRDIVNAVTDALNLPIP